MKHRPCLKLRMNMFAWGKPLQTDERASEVLELRYVSYHEHQTVRDILGEPWEWPFFTRPVGSMSFRRSGR